jgi:glycosyltransferase involved in cell wall biosynthesis
MARLTPENAEFALIAFEGPDEYSRAGGLAVRVRDLSESLAAAGFRTHLFFVGDPKLPGVEERGNLVLHRWSQWISAYHPDGVYDGEWGKMEDMHGSLPPFLVESIVRPAAAAGRVTVLMGEDWQVAGTMTQTANLLAQEGLLTAVIPAWTANNLYGFYNINFAALQQAATVMTVSRYMKHQMAPYGLDPLVTYNGIMPSALVDVPVARRRKLRTAFGSDIALFKIGRFSPDKRWFMAVEAAAMLKQSGTRTRLLIRGDKLPYGYDVLAHAQLCGLAVEQLGERYACVEELAGAIAARPEADVLQLTSFLPDDLLPVIYAAVDGVLANSGFEPFGLVGLEVMGAGGLAFVGSTGEEYAEPRRNAVVLDTPDPREIVVQLRQLLADPAEITRLKRNGKATARAFLWPEVLRELFAKLEYVALTRGVEVPG